MWLRIVVAACVLAIISISSAKKPPGCDGCCGDIAWLADWACCNRRGALYSMCSNNSDCTILNSQCKFGCCQCPLPFYRQNSCNECELVPLVLGAQCSSSVQCAKDIFGAVCFNGVCHCASAYKFDCFTKNCHCVLENSTHWDASVALDKDIALYAQLFYRDRRRLGDQCATDADCSTDVSNSACANGWTCQCASGFQANVCGQCLPAVPKNPRVDRQPSG